MSIIVNGGGGGKSGGSYHHPHSLCSSTTTTSPLTRTTGTILTILFWLPISLLTHLKSLLISPPSAAEISTLSSSGVVSEETKMDPKELKRVFQMFDRNGDGRITQTELNDSLENLGIHIPEMDLVGMIEKIDVNGDGCVDIDEFGDLYQTIMEDKEEEEEEDIKGAFDVFDRNGDGFISVEELRSVLASLGLKQGRTVEDCKVMITKVDVDGDGMVDFMEFKQMMRGCGFAATATGGG